MKQSLIALAALALAGAPALSQPQDRDDLAAQAAAAAEAMQDQLPMRADEVTTAVAIRAVGTEFVYDMQLSEVVPADRLEERQALIQGRNEVRMCEGDAGAFIRRGGSMRHIYTDPQGHVFETRVARCPDAAK
jgi:hypothetical protein